MRTGKRSKNYWNYRIATRIVSGLQGNDLSNPMKSKKYPDERVLSIIEVYYKDGKPDSYIESKNILEDLDSKESIKWTLKKIKKALKREVLDLDNWPNSVVCTSAQSFDEDGNTLKWNVK